MKGENEWRDEPTQILMLNIKYLHAIIFAFLKPFKCLLLEGLLV